MSITEAVLSERSPRSRRLKTSDAVLEALESMCRELPSGEVVPTHTELMRRLEASERSVLWALNELRRRGAIVRRPGAKTVIAGPAAALPLARPGNIHFSRSFGPHAPGSSTPAITHGASRRSRTVLAVLEPDGSYFDMAVQSLMRQAKAENLSVGCCLSSAAEIDDFELPGPDVSPLGYVLFRRDFARLAERLQSAGHRVVLVGEQDEANRRPVANVYAGSVEGGRLAMRHLIALGHRHIFISERYAGVEEAVREARERGIEVAYEPLGKDLVEQWAAAPETAREYFGRPSSPTAVLTWNDQRAIMLLNLLHRAGLRVPDDVSVMGYDNLPQGADLHPALTTVDCAVDLQVSLALRLLMQSDPVGPGQAICVQPSLVVRESCAAPRTVLQP